MAGQPWNKLPATEHLLKGTYRRDRHQVPSASATQPVTPADRRWVLDGLEGEARRVAVRLMAQYSGWDAASLTTLRLYAVSCGKLAGLDASADAQRQREIRSNLLLKRALNLEVPR